MPESETRIALLRRVDGLFELTVTRREGGQAPTYVERMRPLRRPNNSVGERELLEAWELLGAVREIEPPIVEAVRYILGVTVLDPEGERPTLRPLDITPPPAPHQPTAAHPRAYQGTKDRPPKPKRPDLRDLRPYLCAVGSQDRLVRLLRAELGDIELPQEERDAPPGFRRGLAWFATMEPARYEGARSVHHALDLERDVPLRHAAAVFAHDLTKHVIAWLRLACHVEPARRIQFLDLVRETNAKNCDPESSAAGLTAIAANCTDKNFVTRMRYALAVAHKGDAVGDLHGAFELADLHAPAFDFQTYEDEHGDLAPLAEDARRQLQSFYDAYFPEAEWDAMAIWAACCIDEALPGELANIASAQLQAPAARKLGLALAQAILYDDANLASWRECRDALRRFVEAMQGVPFQVKATSVLAELVWEDLLDHLDYAAKLIPLVCVAPLAEASDIDVPLARFGFVSERNRERLLQAADQSYQVLDKEAARSNDAGLISCGFDSLTKHAEHQFAAAFLEHPRTLCRTSRTLGLLAKPQRDAIVQHVMASPLGGDTAVMSESALLECLAQHGPHAATVPIPKRLRQHVAGDVELTEAQLDRATDIARKAWPAIICERMQELALAQMANSLGRDDVDLRELNEQMLHALKLQAGMQSNQRGIRRLLRACHEGNGNYLRMHPRNQAWLQSHHAIADDWLEGIRVSDEVEGHGVVTLAIEHNPLEALRLGSYAGSCLGLGGSFAWSAAGIVLDINKQVVFARDPKGRFLARQVLGMTDTGRLACYDVYPESRGALRKLFRRFDVAFAERLAVSLATDSEGGDEGDTTIPTLVASEWWDDGIWTGDDE
ncbi:MAG: hypothetical protein AB8H80_19715 [Planctomycetota bacterium]